MEDKKKVVFSCCDPIEIDVCKPVENQSRKGGYIEFGEDNKFPQYLFECYSSCSLLQSLCNGLTDYVAGSGFKDNKFENVNANPDMTMEELVKKVALDYVIFGAFSIQVIRNKKGDICELYYMDVQKCRLSEDEDRVYVNSKWDKYARNTEVYDRWDNHKSFPNCIFYYKNPKSRSLYGLPIWSSALKDVRTDMEITNFHLSSILNGFFSPFIINMNNGQPDEEKAKEIEANMVRKFTGSKNAGRFALSFNDSKENESSIVSFPTDDFDTRYEALADSTKENILTAFRASAQLFGVSSQATGFSSIEYKQAFKLFKKTVVEPIQREIEKAFKSLGYDFELEGFVVDFDDEINEQ